MCQQWSAFTRSRVYALTPKSVNDRLENSFISFEIKESSR